MRRGMRDVTVVGAGVVGAAAALALARSGQRVTLLDAAPPPVWSASQPDLRVYALAPDNAALLHTLGVWPQVLARRAQPYRRMRVWDAAGGGELCWDADALARHELGWIVENALLADCLWRAAEAAGVDVRAPVNVTGLEVRQDAARLLLEDGQTLDSALVLAADGAHSRLREWAGIAVSARDYAQQGVVAYVESVLPHQCTAWQRFLPTGPLAVLPVDGGQHSSIVWTLPTAEAQRLLSAPEDAFAGELERALGGRLGAMRLASARAGFPLRRVLAHTQHQGRLLLLGDAAHAVHPLAGQGVNLGLRDVAALYEEATHAAQRGLPLVTSARLARWARRRRSDNVVSAHAFEAINRMYSNDSLPLTLLRGHLLGLAGSLAPLRNALWQHAAGVRL